ncbi:hypothetical protein AB0B45_48905 [Nonomuraea sp. NPDC049152]|uniref:hypothetical protein n=1 Tax=Nonomuraea sp. NPDC049152 TaxID=3154350 RepID=UPI0033C62B63
MRPPTVGESSRTTGQRRRAAPPRVRPENGHAIFFIVEPDLYRLADLARRVQDGRLLIGRRITWAGR